MFVETETIKQSTSPSLVERMSVWMNSPWRQSGRTEKVLALHPNEPFLGTDTDVEI